MKDSIEKLKADSIEKNFYTLNMGPTHPATHGVFENVLLMDGETILEATPTIGYIHRAFEKIAEHRNYFQITPLTDRLNYCSAPINNMGWMMAVEKLLSIEIPKRIQYMRVVVMELSRIADHLVCNSVIGVDSGALTAFVYVFEFREHIYEIFEEICGSRLTTNMGRLGGFERDFSDLAFAKIDKFLVDFPAAMKEFENLLTRNRIFMERTIGSGAISAERALNYGYTGPNLRAAGIDYDVRVQYPYCSYEDFDFKVPVGTTGDSYDRYLVRNMEIWESLSIIQQAITKIRDIDKDPNMQSLYYAPQADKYHLPEKEEVYRSMEALIYHFKIIMGEIDVPVGELYHPVEGANGELGFYLISDGGRRPYRLHFRRPGFVYYQSYPELVKGSMISDAIITMSSLNLIAGEMDA